MERMLSQNSQPWRLIESHSVVSPVPSTYGISSIKYFAAAIAPSTVSSSIATGRSGGSTSGGCDGSALGSSTPPSASPSFTGSVDCEGSATGAAGPSAPSDGAHPTSASIPANAHTSRPRRLTMQSTLPHKCDARHPLVDNLLSLPIAPCPGCRRAIVEKFHPCPTSLLLLHTTAYARWSAAPQTNLTERRPLWSSSST